MRLTKQLIPYTLLSPTSTVAGMAVQLDNIWLNSQCSPHLPCREDIHSYLKNQEPLIQVTEGTEIIL